MTAQTTQQPQRGDSTSAPAQGDALTSAPGRMTAALFALADKHGRRYGAPDEMGYSFELSAFREFCNELQTEAYAEGRKDEADENGAASALIDAWVVTHGKPTPWATAVEIVAIVNKLPADERARLLALAEAA